MSGKQRQVAQFPRNGSKSGVRGHGQVNVTLDNSAKLLTVYCRLYLSYTLEASFYCLVSLSKRIRDYNQVHSTYHFQMGLSLYQARRMMGCWDETQNNFAVLPCTHCWTQLSSSPALNWPSVIHSLTFSNHCQELALRNSIVYLTTIENNGAHNA